MFGAALYITYAEALFFLWQTWQLMLASAALVVLLFAVAGIGVLIRLFHIREVIYE